MLNLIDFFIKRNNPKLVTIACNTATAAALESANLKYDVDILGTAVESTVREAIAKSEKKKVGIIATEATIKSSLYQSELEKQNSEVKIFTKPVPEFVNLVEKDIFAAAEIRKTVVEKLSFFKDAGVDVLILGCTHFPFLKDEISKFLGKDVTMVDNSISTADEIGKLLDKKNLHTKNKNAHINFYTSNLKNINKEFLDFGADYLGIEKLEFEELEL